MTSSAAAKLLQIQSEYERRFNCMICLAPSLKMVYGSCQHRICEQCVYTRDGMRRPGLEKCPCCQKLGAFPLLRPDIPEDNIDMQKNLGICKCPNQGCDLEFWLWELSEHDLTCQKQRPQETDKRRSTMKEDCKQSKVTKKPRTESLGPVLRAVRQTQQSDVRERAASESSTQLRRTPYQRRPQRSSATKARNSWLCTPN